MKINLIKNSLRTKLLLAFTALGVMPVLILGSVIADGQQRSAFEQVNQSLQINLQQLCQEMDYTLEQVLQVETDPEIMEAVLENLPFIAKVEETSGHSTLEIKRKYQDIVFYLQLDAFIILQLGVFCHCPFLLDLFTLSLSVFTEPVQIRLHSRRITKQEHVIYVVYT